MKERLKNLSNKKIVIISLCAFAIVLLLGITYATWSRTFSQSGENISTYDCFNITFTENTDGISMENGYPLTDEEGLQTDAYEITIKNTCNTVASYNVVLNKLNTSTLADEYVKVAVDNDIRLLSETESTESRLSNASEARIIKTGVLTEGQERIIKIQNWMDEATTKEEGSNKTFVSKITIEATAGQNKLLAVNILSDKIQTKKPVFQYGFPQNIYKENITQDSTSIYLSSSLSGDIAIGTGYVLEPESGLFKLTGAKENQKFDRNSVGKYTCGYEKAIYGCATLYKIKEVQESTATEKYTQELSKNQSVDVNGISTTIGKSFSYDPTTGYYTLEDVTENVTITKENIGDYICNNKNTICTFVYKILSVSVGKPGFVSKADLYKSLYNYHKVTKADVYTRTVTDEVTEWSGLNKAEDDEGVSYYFRGEINNNYVSFANKLWRIVRINGDGSIRLITEESIGSERFNSNSDSTSAGYTYNNESVCTKENPCISDTNTSNNFTKNKQMTNSTMKTYLENWYKSNLMDYNDQISLSSYCNDTSISKVENTTTYYGIVNRLNTDMPTFNPTLKCPDTNLLYGGYYKLKIGLITADEMNMAGYAPNNTSTNRALDTNYLYSENLFWWMTPKTGYSSGSADMKLGINGAENYGVHTSLTEAVRPVINLKSDIKVVSGDGTEDNPYVIE